MPVQPLGAGQMAAHASLDTAQRAAGIHERSSREFSNAEPTDIDSRRECQIDDQLVTDRTWRDYELQRWSAT